MINTWIYPVTFVVCVAIIFGVPVLMDVVKKWWKRDG